MSYKTVLVITDKYAPSVSGGAEISLFNILQQMNHYDIRVVVAALSEGRYSLKTEFYLNRTVFRVPFNESWPISLVAAGRIRKLYRMLKFFVSMLRVGNVKSFYRVALATLIWKKWPQHYGLLPLMDADFLVSSRTVSLLQNVVEQVRPDVIHADNFRSIVLAASLKLTIPILSYVRDNRFFCAHKNQAMNIRGNICDSCSFGCVEGRLPEWIETRVKKMMDESRTIRKKALSKSSTIVVTSDFLQKQILSLNLSNDIVKIPNIIERVDEVDKIQREIVTSSVPEILCVGMIGHNKGQTVLLEILEGLASRVSDFKIVIAGRGGMSEELQSIARSKGMLDRIHITGFLSREELYRCYARCFCVVAPTIWPEPFGRVPFEAAASSKPIVAFSVGGLKENIVHEKTGLLVAPKHEKEFEDALVRLLSNPSFAEQLGLNARKELERKLAVQNSAGKLLDEWRCLLKA